MRTLDQAKKFECYHEGAWVPVHWEQLDKGDLVRTSKDTIDGPLTDEFRIVQLPGLEVDPVVFVGSIPAKPETPE